MNKKTSTERLGIGIRPLLGMLIQINNVIGSNGDEIEYVTPSSIADKIEDGTILDYLSQKLSGQIDLHWLNNEEIYPGFKAHLKWALASYQNAYGEPERFKLGLTYFMACLLGVLNGDEIMRLHH